MTGQPDLSPQLAISTKSTEANRTGTWRFERPEFVNKIAPCNEACPLGQDIDVIMDLQARGEIGAALGRILLENPFPGLCGLACHAPCERACNRGRFDQPVSIRALERFAAESGQGGVPETGSGPAGFSVAVAGGGLAGLSCAWFLVKLGHKVTLLADGQGWSGEPDLAPIWERERQRIISAGVVEKRFSHTGAVDVDRLAEEYDGLFIEPGQGRDIQETRVLRSRDFLRRAGADKSIIGHWPAVVGFGPQARKVVKIINESGKEASLLSTGARPENFEDPREATLYWLTGVLGIVRKAGRIQNLLCRREGKEFELPADQVILCLGERNDLEFEPPELVSEMVLAAPAVGKWKDSSRALAGQIALGKGAALGLDMGLKQRTVQEISLAAVGRRGALSLEAYLNPDSGRRWQEVVHFQDLNLDHFKPAGRVGNGSNGETLTSVQALREAGRCFNCGICTHCAKCEEFCPDLSVGIDPVNRTHSFDYDHCKGCGICAEECPRGAIDWLTE